MKCVFCGGTVKKKQVTFSYEDGDKYILVENVPSEVCTRCGEKTYSPEITDKILKFAKNKFKPVKTIEVPVYDFAAKMKQLSTVV
jgi:YgiT-type zinc finger domain-containing protein